MAQNPIGFLRARACWCLGRYAVKLNLKNENGISFALQSIY